MRYSAEHREKTRAQIVDSARAVFSEFGYEHATIDDVMAHAGLTRGGFYLHFRSKEALFVETILTGVVDKAYEPWADSGDATASAFEAMVASYVGDKHFRQKEVTCPLIAFPSDVARGGPALRGAYETVARSIAAALAGNIDAPDRRERSLAALSMIVGAMVIARGVKSSQFERDVRMACLRQAKSLGLS